MRGSIQCKHIVAVSLILALAAGMLLFTVPAQAQTKLTFMLWGQPKPWMDELAAKRGYEIEWLVGGRHGWEVAEKFRLALAANEGIPDIIQYNNSHIPEFAEAGVLTDLTDHFEPYLDNIPKMVQELVSWDGRIIGFPYQIKTKQYYYRKDLFDEAGIDVAQIKTIDDFIAAGKKLQEKFPGTYMWNLGNQSIHYDLFGFVTAFDGMWNDEDGNYVADTDPGLRKAFEAMYKIKHSGVVDHMNDWTPDWEAGFADGTLAGQLIFSWMRAFLERYAPDQGGKWAVTTWPEEIQKGAEGGSMFVVPVGAPNKEEAIKFLTQIRLEKEGALEVYKLNPNPPITFDVIDDPIVSEPHPYYGTSYMESYKASLEKATLYPFSPKAGLEKGILLQYLDAYLTDKMNLDDALAGLQNDLVNQLGNAYD